jgi:hypothetical protein
MPFAVYQMPNAKWHMPDAVFQMPNAKAFDKGRHQMPNVVTKRQMSSPNE